MKGTRSVITVGNFDGVHAGHAELVRRARKIADEAGAGTRVLALTFDPHPMTRLKPGAAPAGLMSFARRAELLKSLGVDEVVRIEPTTDVLNRTAEQFVRAVAETYKPVAFVEGADFRFGKGRTGDVHLLKVMGSHLGFGVEAVSPVEVVLEDLTIVPASSTMTRWLIRHGRVRDAARMLRRPHELRGRVVQGDRRGRTIGFPTANLKTEDMRPGDGVYAAVAHVEGGGSYAAAVNVGNRPTFAGMEHRIEAHLLIDEAAGGPAAGRAGLKPGAGGGSRTEVFGVGGPAAAWRALPGVAEYGWGLRLELIGWVRDQVRFDSPARLVEQVRRDCVRVARMVEEAGAPRPEEVMT